MAAKAFVPITVGWMPDHTGLAGNEMADKLARIELTSPDSPTIMTDQITLAAMRRKSRELTRKPLKE